tara:strand:+ start:779 stop:1390 length:612 start_codon:yes stop_codon:yes gene_type:complete
MKINTFQDSKDNKLALLALHGWTGDEFSMEVIANETGYLSAKWYLPRAPYNADTGKGYTWFSGSDEKGWKYEKTLDMMPKIMQRIFDDGFSPENIFIIGFSMGAGLAILFSSRLPYSIGGVIPISGYIMKKEHLLSAMTQESLNTPFLIIQGSKDEIVTPIQSRSTANLLISIGYNVVYKTFDAQHKIPKEAIPLIKEFILNK